MRATRPVAADTLPPVRCRGSSGDRGFAIGVVLLSAVLMAAIAVFIARGSQEATDDPTRARLYAAHIIRSGAAIKDAFDMALLDGIPENLIDISNSAGPYNLYELGYLMPQRVPNGYIWNNIQPLDPKILWIYNQVRSKVSLVGTNANDAFIWLNAPLKGELCRSINENLIGSYVFFLSTTPQDRNTFLPVDITGSASRRMEGCYQSSNGNFYFKVLSAH